VPLRVCIVAAVRLYQDGLAYALGRRPWIEVVGTTGTVADLPGLRADVVLVDALGTDARAAIRAIRREAVGVKVVALSVTEREEELLELAEAGADGFVTRDGSLEDLLSALENVGRGEAFCPPKFVGVLLRRVAFLAAESRTLQPLTRLTPREREIVALIDEGLSNKEIAARLTIEVATVKNHVHNILEKLQVRRRGEAVARFREAL
jgi:two-component system, NarL family, nitrate/nitrite response regulator NarL